ncbi:TetR/AcrR family transcriptional regulator [Kangiella sp. TOML190]|uniref:TetR/AcrR family transcriptional regulator n=1 Tax=Kangiella sp. TOML190 TaxID=2931351 RepID=UPI00203FBC5E|nr:TetR/AcrR family transcriptional regulator [Kangiella sp. TOML190]
MNMKTKDTRQHILEVGYQLIANKGFSSVGLTELLKAAQVPKGSFYHYFKSKEQFGVELIRGYFHNDHLRAKPLLEATDQSGYERLMNYWKFWIPNQSEAFELKRSLVVALAGEVSEQSEPMRAALEEGSQQSIKRIVTAIEAGIADGSIKSQNSAQAAELLYSLWIGASLVAKVRQDHGIFDLALRETELKLSQGPN